MNKNIFIIFIFIITFLIVCKKTIENFGERVYFIDKNTKKVVKEMVYYQHNELIVNEDNLKYCNEVKKQLLHNISSLLKSLNIKFVISHGNLIEFARKASIHHDDDIDIRMCSEDFDKWIKYCKKLNCLVDNKYNLKYDHRIFNFEEQKDNGIQIRLNNLINNNNIKIYNMDIHCDLVLNTIESETWIKYDIDFNNLREVKYLGTTTYAPSEEDTDRILKKEYGENYIKPNFKPYSLK